MSESSAPNPVQTIDMSHKPAVDPIKSQPDPISPVQKVPEPKQDDKFAAKFAALTRKEREVREREGKSKVEVDAAKAQVEQYRNKYGQYESLDETLKTDKRAGLKFLMDKGLSVEELSDMLLEELNPDPEKKLAKTTSDIEKRLMDRIAALEGKLTAKDQADIDAQKDTEKANFEKTVTQVKSDIKQFVDNESGDYELIKLNEAYETVFDVMQEHYDDQVRKGVSPDGIKILSYEDAAKWTEAYLDEQATKQYEAKRAKQVLKPEPVKTKATTPTLSNTLSTEVSSQVEPKARTREESLRQAARLLRFSEE